MEPPLLVRLVSRLSCLLNGRQSEARAQPLALLPTPLAQDAERLAFKPNMLLVTDESTHGPSCAAKDGEDCKPTNMARDLNKYETLRDIKKTDIDAKIECGHGGELQFPGRIYFIMRKTGAEHP